MAFVQGIISITLSVIVLASVFIPVVKGTNTTTPTGVNGSPVSWSAGELALWGVMTIIAIMGLVYGIAQTFGLA